MPVFGDHLGAGHQDNQGRSEGHAQEGSRGHREGLRKCQRLEQAALLSFQREDGQETHRDHEQGKKQRLPQLLAGGDDDLLAFPPGQPGRGVLQAFVDIFDHDHGLVAKHADGDRDPRQRHDVGRESHGVHRNERQSHRDGQRHNRPRRPAKIEEEHDHDHADDETFLDNRPGQRVDGTSNQVGSVVGGDNLDALRQRRLNLGQLLFQAVDDPEHVLPVPHHHDATHGLALPIQVPCPAAHLGPEGDVARNVLEQDGSTPGIGTHHHQAQFVEGAKIAMAAHEVGRSEALEFTAADVVV